MSNQPVRKETDCLNCGEAIHGRFCHNCGQENLVTRQNFWSLVKHFIFDLFHFDGKFFDTLKYLITRPGKVARDFVSGKRVRYLDPFRMYLFTSAVFFLIFFSVSSPDLVDTGDLSILLSKSERLDLVMELNARNKADSLLPSEKAALAHLVDSSQTILLISKDSIPPDSLVRYNGKPYRYFATPNKNRFDPLEEQTWLGRVLQKKMQKLDQQYDGDAEKGMKNFLKEIFHLTPYLLFVSLPFFALILKLIYVRRKQFYYSDHIIFTLYHYITSFILMLFLMGITGLYRYSGWNVFRWIVFAGVIYWFIYLYKGMRHFYGQSRTKTLGKYLLLNVLGLILFLILVFCFFLFSIIEF